MELLAQEVRCGARSVPFALLPLARRPASLAAALLEFSIKAGPGRLQHGRCALLSAFWPCMATFGTRRQQQAKVVQLQHHDWATTATRLGACKEAAPRPRTTQPSFLSACGHCSIACLHIPLLCVAGDWVSRASQQSQEPSTCHLPFNLRMLRSALTWTTTSGLWSAPKAQLEAERTELQRRQNPGARFLAASGPASCAAPHGALPQTSGGSFQIAASAPTACLPLPRIVPAPCPCGCCGSAHCEVLLAPHMHCSLQHH